MRSRLIPQMETARGPVPVSVDEWRLPPRSAGEPVPKEAAAAVKPR